MDRHEAFVDPRQLLDIRPQQVRAQRTVQAHAQRAGVAQAVVERLGGLAGQCAAALVGNGAGDHYRQPFERRAGVEIAADGEHRRLGIQRIEDGFDQQQVGAAGYQAIDGLGVGHHQLVETHIAVAGIVDVRADAAGAVGRAEHAGDKARSGRIACRFGIAQPAYQRCRTAVHLVDQRFHAVIGHGDRRRIESVGLDNVGAGIEIGLVNAADHVRARQHQQVVVAFYVAGPVGKALAAIVGFLQLVALDHGAHAAVENQDAFGKQGGQAGGSIGHGGAADGNGDWVGESTMHAARAQDDGLLSI